MTTSKQKQPYQTWHSKDWEITFQKPNRKIRPIFTQLHFLICYIEITVFFNMSFLCRLHAPRGLRAHVLIQINLYSNPGSIAGSTLDPTVWPWASHSVVLLSKKLVQLILIIRENSGIELGNIHGTFTTMSVQGNHLTDSSIYMIIIYTYGL